MQLLDDKYDPFAFDPDDLPDVEEPEETTGASFLMEALQRMKPTVSVQTAKTVQTYAEVLSEEGLDPVRMRLGLVADALEEMQGSMGNHKHNLRKYAAAELKEMGDLANREKLSEKGINLDATTMVLFGVQKPGQETQVIDAEPVAEDVDLDADFSDDQKLLEQFNDGFEYTIDEGFES